MHCRICGGDFHLLANLGIHPIANNYSGSVKWLEPLILVQCKKCFVVQTETSPNPTQIYNEFYGYMTGNSKEWVKEHADFYKNFGVQEPVLEIGSNDGSVLQNFRSATGFEPSLPAHKMAVEKGLQSFNLPFYFENAEKLNLKEKFKTVIANNVLAHDSNIAQIIKGMYYVLEQDGTAIIELQDALNLLHLGLYDCIYHEHYFHFSQESLTYVMSLFGFSFVSCFKIPHHGGSIRCIFRKTGFFGQEPRGELLPSMQRRVDNKFDQITQFFRENGPMPAFGAPAKAVTVCNRSKLDRTDINFIVDETPIKQFKLLPGTNLPIVDFRHLQLYDVTGVPPKPIEKMVIFPWNFKEEISKKLRAWRPNLRLFVLFPEIKEI